jgi:hypothetical protein
MSIAQSNMQNSSRPRLSHGPEKLILNKTIYDPDSDCARTFFILGEVVVWSHAYHIQIISQPSHSTSMRLWSAEENRWGEMSGDSQHVSVNHDLAVYCHCTHAVLLVTGVILYEAPQRSILLRDLSI